MNLSRGTYNVLRSVVVTALVAVVVLFALAYLVLMSPPMQARLCREGEKALSEYLNTTVDIGSVTVKPFNQLDLKDVLINDQQGDSLLTIDKLGAGISLKDLIADGRIVVTYGEIMGLNGHVTRPDKASPTNMQFIIDAFKPKDDKPPKPFDVQVKTVVVRKSALNYDVLDQPHKQGQIDPNHLAVKNLRADLSLPCLKNNDFDIRVKRLSFDEQSGFSLQRMSTNVHITDNAMDIQDVKVKLPGSDIRLDDVHLEYSSLKELGNELQQMPLRISTPGSTVTPSDLKAFLPQLKNFTEPMRITADVVRDGNRIEFPELSVHTANGGLALNARGGFSMPTRGGYQTFDLDRIDLDAKASEITQITGLITALTPQAKGIISRCGNITLDGELHGTGNNLRFNGDVGTSLGAANLDGTLAQHAGTTRFNGHVKTDGLKLGDLLNKKDLLNEVAMDAQVDATMHGNDVSGHLQGHIPFVDFKGTRYHDITADVVKQGNDYNGTLAMNDPNGRVNIEGRAVLAGENSTYEMNISTRGLNLAQLGLANQYSDHKLDMNAAAAFWGNTLDNAKGLVELENVSFADAKGKGLHINSFSLSSDNDGEEKVIDINTDHIKGSIRGQYDFKTIVPTVKHMLSSAFPQYFGNFADYAHAGNPNNVEFDFEITPDDQLNEILNLPIYPFYQYTIKGDMNESDNRFNVVLDAPYMKQGNKFITKTRVEAKLDSKTDKVIVNAKSLYPIKNGKRVNLAIDLSGQNNRLDGNLGWLVMKDENDTITPRKFNGNINLSALLDRGENGKLKADVMVNPSTMVFNDTIWTVGKGLIAVDNGEVTVQNLGGGHDNQYIRINGKASHDPSDSLCLELMDFNLDYLFETLAIDHVSFGGKATSKIIARDVFSGSPILYTPSLLIDDISYNGAVLGDADIKATFDNDTKGILVEGDIAQPNGHNSTLWGGIYVADDSLYIAFDADHVNVAFLKPYMEAFTSDVQGEMSGKPVLFGNFHTINLDGDIVADTMSFYIDYVKCHYTCSNVPVHIVPDLIEFNNLPIHDREGHEARLGGWLKHDAFHSPVFNFAITDAKDFLCYDTSPADNPRWYGTIYGNGACFVEGGPGEVKIKVNMDSAPHSTFTFVLSDDEQANDYHFITFRDREAKPEPEPVEAPDKNSTAWILSNINKMNFNEPQQENAEPSAYFIDLEGNITPDVALTVVMDPVGGDQIKATGHGNMRLTYNNNDELNIFGTYKLDKGTYNFTLQDLIIKDFTIQDGSSIRFQGDPFAAELDLDAVYSLNANLKDLDESFGDDPDLNRTNVPVNAELYAKGIITQPDISFDLKFPTLTSDAYHKVKSIISTDEMMNRQIIYLLALNRFYTPDYMGTTMNQNEVLSSVASSTISGQLSNILGKIADNLSIAPNFRTDKGDFSDMEVDVALSSQLLNNRLLLNGNFGYRDNTFNTTNTNFIGDFDIEYLLNSKGTIRLKAYNHFNDQNYYLRNALTTQGVGIGWKHDFDKPKDKKRLSLSPADSIPTRAPSPDRRDDSTGVRQPVPMVTLRPATGSANPTTEK